MLVGIFRLRPLLLLGEQRGPVARLREPRRPLPDLLHQLLLHGRHHVHRRIRGHLHPDRPRPRVHHILHHRRPLGLRQRPAGDHTDHRDEAQVSFFYITQVVSKGTIAFRISDTKSLFID